MISNKDTYLSIAREAHAAMTEHLSAERTPKPDGSPGFIIKFNPARASFKQALICTAFCATYFEALMYLTIRVRFSKNQAEKFDHLPYKDRLVKLGINDQNLLAQAEELQDARSDLIHEKAIPIEEIDGHEAWVAQDVADAAIAFVERVNAAIQPAP